MQLHIGGGYKEHGRNCFLISCKGVNILFDCGIMVGDPIPYPNLSTEQIKSIHYLFISHSHLDHCGALQWLYENGFSAKVLLTTACYEQMAFKPKEFILIDKATPPCHKMLEDSIEIEWGKSGHCEGAAWYHVFINQQSVLFSGDYCEGSKVYYCHELRGVSADIALIDCAYYYDTATPQQNTQALLDTVNSLLKKSMPIVFPVPKFGRKEEIALLLKEHFSQIPVLDYAQPQASFIFLTDPQLKTHDSIKLVDEALLLGGAVILTGNCDKGSYSKQLLDEGKATFRRFNVHQNLATTTNLCNQNHFKKVYLTHYQQR